MKILHTADWHLRADRPRCRTDENWIGTQRHILRYIATKAIEEQAFITAGGDLFDTPRVPDEIVQMVLEEFSEVNLGIMAGNHDLPYHSWENVSRCSFGTLWAIVQKHRVHIQDLSPVGDHCHWGTPIVPGADPGKVLFLHRLVFPALKDLPPGVDACLAQDLLDEFPGYTWILTGDMHKAFHYRSPDGRHVVNPGSITRQTADQKDYQPQAWLINTDLETVTAVPLPDTGALVDDAYLRKAEERDDRITAFVEKVRTGGTVTLDFLENVRQARLETPLDKASDRMLDELLEGATE